MCYISSYTVKSVFEYLIIIGYHVTIFLFLRKYFFLIKGVRRMGKVSVARNK